MATVYIDQTKDNFISILLNQNDTVSIQQDNGTIIRKAGNYSSGCVLASNENFIIIVVDK